MTPKAPPVRLVVGADASRSMSATGTMLGHVLIPAGQRSLIISPRPVKVIFCCGCGWNTRIE